MTVFYPDKKNFRVLLRWQGSVWKAVWRNYAVFIISYYLINFTYRFGLTVSERQAFERLVNYFNQWQSVIPLQFLLGFYVSLIIDRWWNRLNYVAWPDKLLTFILANIPGHDAYSLSIRRQFARYCALLSVICWRDGCTKIRKRFPTIDHIQNAGLMTATERSIFDKTNGKHGKWFVPAIWMVKLLARCRQEKMLTDYAFQKLLDEIYAFRTTFGMLFVYDWIDIPLVYTQVVTVATYGYFMFCLISRQALMTDVDVYFPWFTTLEFVFYVGWYKVAAVLRDPFGEDDEDFDMNYILDRNIHIGNLLVDTINRQEPSIEKDPFEGLTEPELPHTVSSFVVRDKIPSGKFDFFKLSDYEARVVERTVAEMPRSLSLSDLAQIISTDPPVDTQQLETQSLSEELAEAYRL